MEYKDVLAYYIDKQGLTPAEVARRINSPRSTVNELLKGRAKEPTLGKAKAIADALGVPLEEMVDMIYGEGKGEATDE